MPCVHRLFKKLSNWSRLIAPVNEPLCLPRTNATTVGNAATCQRDDMSIIMNKNRAHLITSGQVLPVFCFRVNGDKIKRKSRASQIIMRRSRHLF